VQREWHNGIEGSTNADDRQAFGSAASGQGKVIGKDTTMKRITLIAGLASVAALTSVAWSVPASATMCGSSACAVVHNRLPGRSLVKTQTSQTSPSGVPEPGVLPLLAFALGGVGFVALRRKRARV
jgi:hypothetical protein